VAPARYFAGLPARRRGAKRRRKVAAAGTAAVARKAAALVSAERSPQGLAVMGKGLKPGLYRSTAARGRINTIRTDADSLTPGSLTTGFCSNGLSIP